MIFKIKQKPNNSPFKLGEELSESQMAEYFELNLPEMLLRAAMAAEINISGYALEVII